MNTAREPTTEECKACGEDVLYILGVNTPHRLPIHVMNALIIAIAERVKEAEAAR
jgi:hypothetical protein